MTPTVGWFPRFSPSGAVTAERAGAWRAQWLRDGEEIYGNGTHLVIGGQETTIPDGNALSAAGGRWAVLRTDPVRVFTSDGGNFPGAGAPAITARDFACVDVRQAAQQHLLLNGEQIAYGSITDVRLSTQALVWSQAGETWGLKLQPRGTPQRLQVALWESRPIPIDTPDGPWVGCGTQTGILVRPFGSKFGYHFDNGGETFYPDWIWLNGQFEAVFTNHAGVISFARFSQNDPRVDLSAPPTPIVIGPVSSPRAADGRLYDLAPFIHSNPALQPRSGPTHPQHQVETPEGLIYFVKFGNPQAYECWPFDENWRYHIEDASGNPPMHFTDPRWWPRHLPIGEAHAFVTGPHEGVFTERGTCKVLRRDPWERKMWLHAVYDAWQWGADLGKRPTIMLVYDGTGGTYNAERFIEVCYFALDAGWCRWEAYYSNLVYQAEIAKFAKPAQFLDSARAARSDFYLVGGPAVLPQLTGCVPQVVPHLSPLPTPQPVDGFQKPIVFTPGGHVLQEKGGVINVKGKFGRLGPIGSGVFGRRGFIWDGDAPTGDYEFTLTEIANGPGWSRGQAVDTKNSSCVGADLTQYSTDETHQFYGLKPDETPGEYEQPFLYIETDQNVKALVFRFPQAPDRPHAFVTSLTWVTQ